MYHYFVEAQAVISSDEKLDKCGIMNVLASNVDGVNWSIREFEGQEKDAEWIDPLGGHITTHREENPKQLTFDF